MRPARRGRELATAKPGTSQSRLPGLPCTPFLLSPRGPSLGTCSGLLGLAMPVCLLHLPQGLEAK